MIIPVIHVIDDEQSIRDGITMTLTPTYRVESFESAEEALSAMAESPPDLVLLDIGLPGMSGIEALHRIRKEYPDVLVIIITAYEDSRTIIQAMKLGAYDYVIKPILMDGLEVTIANAIESIRLKKEVQYLQQRYLQENLPCFIAESNAIQDVMDFISRVAKSPDTPILILGETGTGKELIASAIHYRSPNFKGPLVTVNCATIPRDLIESELFGYEKGAFSGANPCGKRGLIEDAEGGTLFLDEVGDLNLEAQAKLLRFLEEGEFYRLGSTRKLYIKTRVVSATNKNLSLLIERGLFRSDLYYRLGVITVNVPSLNERKEDIVPLAAYFLGQFGKKFGRAFRGISREAQAALLAKKWTGNIRELRNLIERASLIAPGDELTVEDLGIVERGRADASIPPFPPIPPEGIDFPALERSFGRYYIDEAIRLSGGNETKAARLLNINHHTLRYRKKKLEDGH